MRDYLEGTPIIGANGTAGFQDDSEEEGEHSCTQLDPPGAAAALPH